MQSLAAETQPAPRFCESCGSRITGRWEKITPGLCKSLIKFYTAICAKRENSVHLQKEVDLSKSEYNNFQKLRYFALAVKVKERSGYWLITSRGRDFIRNNFSIPQRVLIFHNHIEDRSKRTVNIAQVIGTQPYWLKRDDFLGTSFATDIDQDSLF